MEIVSRVHARNLVEWARERPEVVVLSADLTGSTEIDLFREKYPDRFFSMGMAEQNMLSLAGGLAREGFTPFVHTFAVFLYRRALDQIAMSICYPNLPVRLFGFLPGITTPGGATHQAIDDIAVLRSLPNLTILETGDATEVETVLDAAHRINGPVYIRMLRGEIPRLFPSTEPLRVGEGRILGAPGEGPVDLTLFSTGICTEEALRATKLIRDRGVSVLHVHISTLKPFNSPFAVECAGRARLGVITLENHTIIGGLGTAVAEALARAGAGKPLMTLGLPDVFAHGASRPYLMREYGLDALSLVRAVEKMMGRELKIEERDLQAVRLEPLHGEAKAEAL